MGTNKTIKMSCDDIRVEKRAITSLSVKDSDARSVVEICVSMFVIPKEDLEPFEYEKKVGAISRFCDRSLREYVRNNSKLFDGKCIVDVNFSAANLKKGYNKSVQIVVFARQKRKMSFVGFRNELKKSIKPVVSSITSRMVGDGFRCYKKKQANNTKLR